MTNNELAIIEVAKTINVTDEQSLASASTYLIQAKKLYKADKEDMDTLLAPFKEGIDGVKEKYEPRLKALKSLIDDLGVKTSQYQTNLVNTQQKAEEDITARIAPGKGNLTLETAVKKLDSLPEIQKNVTTDAGSMSFIAHPMCELEDITLLPIKYHLADMVAVRAEMKAGNKLPGVRYWTEQRPRNSR